MTADVEARLAVLEIHAATNAAEIAKLREKQGGIELLAQQIEWMRQELARREKDQKERDEYRERELREFVQTATETTIQRELDNRASRWNRSTSLVLQGAGWLVAATTLLLGATHHL